MAFENFPTVDKIEWQNENETNSWVIKFPSFLSSAIQTTSENGAILNPEIAEQLELAATFSSDDPTFYQCISRFKWAQLLMSFSIKGRRLLISTPGLNDELFFLKAFEKLNPGDKESFEKQQRKLQTFSQEVMQINRSLNIADVDWIAKHHQLDGLDKFEVEEIKTEEEKIKNEVDKIMRNYRPGFFERCSDFGLHLSAEYDLIRIHILKFLATLPSLNFKNAEKEIKSNFREALRRLIKDSKQFKTKSLPLYLIVLFKMVYYISAVIPPQILAPLIKKLTGFVAERFIAGSDIENGKENLVELLETGRSFTLDQLGELVVSEEEADHYLNRVLSSIRQMKHVVPLGKKNAAGILESHISIKVSALCDDFQPLSFDYTYSKIAPRLTKILLLAREEKVFINIDAEHYHYRDLVFEIYKKVLLETPKLADYQQTGIVLQCYLRDAFDHFQDVLELAQKRNLCMPIRFVKGAYWDAETIEADAHSFRAPQFLNKVETDVHFRQLIVEGLKNPDHLQVCVAGHNLRDHTWSEALRSIRFPQAPVIEHQCLHMTYEALSVALTEYGYCVRNYVPVGDLIVGMGYLVRRIMENSSQVGVLAQSRSKKSQKEWLAPQTYLSQMLEDPPTLKQEHCFYL
jgi:RHH-type proline utilization regulon transcriptional repressor/proline dehydrogenase/delta 1-pyrroline-5-carboxylate dehydrogenase